MHGKNCIINSKAKFVPRRASRDVLPCRPQDRTPDHLVIDKKDIFFSLTKAFRPHCHRRKTRCHQNGRSRKTSVACARPHLPLSRPRRLQTMSLGKMQSMIGIFSRNYLPRWHTRLRYAPCQCTHMFSRSVPGVMRTSLVDLGLGTLFTIFKERRRWMRHACRPRSRPQSRQ